MNIDITNGKKAKFDSVEDVMQTFVSIAIAVYDVASHECIEDGVATVRATTDKGKIRIRIDYMQEGEEDD